MRRARRFVAALVTTMSAVAVLSGDVAHADEPAPVAATPVSDGALVETATAVGTAGTDGRRAAFSLQAGWWTFEAELRTRFGLYASAGVPWAAVPVSVLNGATWVVPVGARVGYQHALSPRWSLRGSAQVAYSASNEGGAKCGCGSSDTVTHTFAFAAVGLRYESTRGIIGGLDVPIVGLRVPHHWFLPPEAQAFTQVYVGYTWGL